MSIDGWTYEDFLTYLLILGAKADLSISEGEKENIIQKVGEEEFNKVKRVFDKQNDAQHIDTVAQLYDKYKVKIGGKESLVQALKEIILTDKTEETMMDRELLMMLKKIL